MPQLHQEPIHFGEKQSNEEYRRTVVCALYNPTNKEYIYEYWEQYYELVTLVSGGVEADEDIIEALKREILEETGYTDFEVVDKLGGDIYAHYYQPKKDKYYQKHISAYLVILKSEAKQADSKEEDEKFEVLSASFDELLKKMKQYKNPNRNTVEDQIKILNRAKEYIDKASL